MSDNADRVAATISANVRALRSARGLTLDGLVAMTGLSKGTLVALEQGRGNPSIGTLCQLTESLGIGLQQLLEDPSGPFVKVRRVDDAAELWSTPGGSGAHFLLGTDPPDGVELWEWEIAHGEHFDGGAHPLGTRELLTVRTGCLGVRIEDRVAELGPGDSILFEATVPHRYLGLSMDPARFTMVVLIADLAGLDPMDASGSQTASETVAPGAAGVRDPSQR